MLKTGTKCVGVAFIFKAMPKLDHLGVLFQELREKGSKCFDVVNRLLLVTPHPHIGVDTISHCCAKMMISILCQLRLTQAGPKQASFLIDLVL